MAQEDLFKKLVAHCKEYGYVFPSSEIYDGLSAVYDYGQYGVELKNNIKKYWWDSMVLLHENVVGLDSAIFMHPTIWKASGHVDAFNDPLIDNKDSKKRYRADVLIEDGVIVSIGNLADQTAGADEVIEADGLLVMPGGIDPHTHLDMPFGGTVSSDDFFTGHKAAAFGGTIFYCVNTYKQS